MNRNRWMNDGMNVEMMKESIGATSNHHKYRFSSSPLLISFIFGWIRLKIRIRKWAWLIICISPMYIHKYTSIKSNQANYLGERRGRQRQRLLLMEMMRAFTNKRLTEDTKVWSQPSICTLVTVDHHRI